MKQFAVVIMILWGMVACAKQPPETEIPVAQMTIPVERATETAVSTNTAVPPTTTPLSTLTPLPTQTLEPVPTATTTQIPTLSPTSVTLAAVPPAIWTTIGTPMPPVQTILSPENITQIQEIGRWGKGKVIDAVYSPDGQKLAVATALGVYFYDANTAELLSTISITGHLLSLALSPDWQTLAVGIGIGIPNLDIQIWSVESAIPLYTISQLESEVSHLSFSPDGQTLFAGGMAWRVSDGVQINVAQYPMRTVSDDGQWAISSDENDYDDIRIWHLENDRFVDTQQVIPNSSEIQYTKAMAISPDGQLIAAGGWDLIVAVWHVQDGSLAYTVDISAFIETKSSAAGRLGKRSESSGPGRHTIEALQFSSDGQMLLVATGFEDITFLQAQDGSFLNSLENAGTDFIFSPDGTRIASWAHTLSQWRVQDGSYINQLSQHAGMVQDVAFTPDNRLLAIASSDSRIYLWQSEGSNMEYALAGHSGGVTSIDISQEGQKLVSGSIDGSVRIWNLTDYISTGWITSSFVEEVGLSFDKKAVASTDGYLLELRQAADGSLIRQYGEGVRTCPIAFSPIEFLFATCWDFEPVALWTLEGSRALADPEGFSIDSAEDFAFSPDGQYLASISYNLELRLWRVADGQVIYTAKISGGGINPSLAFSPDGQLLAVVMNYDVQLWDVVSGVYLHTIPVGGGFLSSAAFSPNGRFLAVGSHDGTVRLWGVP